MPAAPGTTLLELVNVVARSVGHTQTSTVQASPDEAILRMQYYANLCGTQLTYMCNWQILSRTAIIQIEADTIGQTEKAFALPADFKAMTDDTHWDRSTQLPAIGPINAQDWQWLVVRNTQITTRFMWRIRDGFLWVKSPPPPGSPQPLSFEYLSKYWAYKPDPGGGDDIPVEAMQTDDSFHIYNPQLMVLYTRAKWFENEGYDASAALADFFKAFQWESGTDKGATALSLVPGMGYPYISAVRNIPDTGYGSSY